MMAGEKFVLAYDGSAGAQKALTAAADLAKKAGAQLHLLAVADVRISGFDEAVIFDLLNDTRKQQAQEIVVGGAKRCAELGIAVHTAVAEGHPVDEVIKYARKISAGLIIAGSRGRGGFEQMLLGSVAHKLVAYSDIPVMIVK